MALPHAIAHATLGLIKLQSPLVVRDEILVEGISRSLNPCLLGAGCAQAISLNDSHRTPYSALTGRIKVAVVYFSTNMLSRAGQTFIHNPRPPAGFASAVRSIYPTV